MKPIIILTVPHAQQRYDTCGDYRESQTAMVFKISECDNWKYEALVAVHELIEKVLCNAHGITDQQIDAFDLNFTGEGEPGEHEAAPYILEHGFATMIERQLADALCVDWDAYDAYIGNLEWKLAR